MKTGFLQGHIPDSEKVQVQHLLEELKKGNPITVEMGRRTLFYENGHYFEQTPEGEKKILLLKEAREFLRTMVARWRSECH